MQCNLKKNVSIVILGETKAFDDIILPLYFSLKRLHYNVSIVKNKFFNDTTNIIMGLCDYPDIDINNFPKDSIIYNLEQLVSGSKAFAEGYINACAKFPVWDYSEDNIKRFRELYNIDNVCHVPLGYCPEMTRIFQEYPKDIDVLLYGAMNDRRVNMIKI